MSEAFSDAFSDIRNFRQAGPDLATSGQPTEADFADIAEAGYEVIINLALHDDPRYSLADEPGTVRALGMYYIHIPVTFDHPARDDLLAFLDAMQRNHGRRIWVHCAANYRVSAFVGLHRVLREGWAQGSAFELMDGVWKPNKTWAAFIAAALEEKPPA